jgi:hypothetical protein
MRKMCAFCGGWYDMETMTPLYEDGKTFVLFYCEGCFPAVKSNIAKLHYSRLFTWGTKGNHNEKNL